MKLVQVPNKFVRLNESLPFAIRDVHGRLMLAAHVNIDQTTLLSVLKGRELFADEAEASAWRRDLMGGLVRPSWNDADLHRLARALPQQGDREAAPTRELTLIELWTEQVVQLVAALRDLRPDSDWQARLTGVAEQARALAARRLDASLYHLVFSAGHTTDHHSANHALLCMTVAREIARMLGWPEARIEVLDLAALTMNVAVRRIQDQLARGAQAIAPAVREELAAHPARGAEQLEAAGATDAAWLDIVRRHHDAIDAAAAGPLATDVECAVALLRRVDAFAERLNRRGVSRPVLPVQAVREACLGVDGRPDQIGAALL